MRHVIQEIVDVLESFINHEAQSVMIVEAQSEEAALLLKTFGMVEESETSPDIFLTFVDDFKDTRRFVENILEHQREQIEQLNVELEKKGEEPIPQIPEKLFGRDRSAKSRLLRLFAHIRKVVDPERQVIWVFYPMTDVKKEDRYLKLFSAISNNIAKGKLANTKLIIRDTPSKLLKAHFGIDDEEPKPEFTWYRPKLDFDSVMKKIEEQADSDDAPEEEKMQSIMLMAGVDVAEKKYDKALDKNQKVLRYYKKTKQKQNESIVRNNIGDIHYLQGDFPEAEKNYDKAINIAVEEKSQPLVLYQSINLGNSLFMQERYDEAFIYYDSAEKLADVNKILNQRIHAMERMGRTKHASGDLDESLAIYEKAADICREEGYKLGLRNILDGLIELHADREDAKSRRACRKEFDQVTKELEDIEPNLVQEASAA